MVLFNVSLPKSVLIEQAYQPCRLSVYIMATNYLSNQKIVSMSFQIHRITNEEAKPVRSFPVQSNSLNKRRRWRNEMTNQADHLSQQAKIENLIVLPEISINACTSGYFFLYKGLYSNIDRLFCFSQFEDQKLLNRLSYNLSNPENLSIYFYIESVICLYIFTDAFVQLISKDIVGHVC